KQLPWAGGGCRPRFLENRERRIESCWQRWREHDNVDRNSVPKACRISEKWITGGGPESPVHSLPASSENKRASNNPLDERESTDFRSRFRSLRPSMKLLRSNQGTRYSSRGHRAIQLASGLHHASGSRLPLPAGGTFFVVLSFYGRVQR